MKIAINPVVLLRIPAFSLTDQLEEVWEALKLSISQSSTVFYEKIKLVSAADLKHLDFKVQFTIWKYFNRSKFRGTPYGSFAGIATCKLTDDEAEVIFSNTQHMHRFKDWSHRNDRKMSDNDLSSSERLYFANLSNYNTTSSIRFLSFQDEVFELSEIEHSIFISDLLSLCSVRANYQVIRDFAEERAVAEKVLHGILKAMIGIQLLFTDLDPNIIGPDYFNRTHQSLSADDQAYFIAERKVSSGGVNKTAFNHFPDCINYLNKKLLYSENQDIKDFKSAFIKRFDQQEIQLMRALDPELGVGYGDLEESINSAPLQFSSQELRSSDSFPVSLTEFGHEVLRLMLKGKGDPCQVIRLEQQQQRGQDAPNKLAVPPSNSFSALARVAGNLVVVESLGGCTANALLGRFTMASEVIEEHCKAIAAQESEANPGVIFFDLAYTAEGSVDNINRRKSIYEYEVPVLNYSCAAQPIPLNDLLVAIKDNEVILLSKKYGKRVVPRLASAYNYGRSDLSVYRFLCDLQHQNIQSQLTFDIQVLLPGLDFYPRIQYENLVLSTTKWRVRASDLKKKNVAQMLAELGVSPYFSAGSGDQTLCFNSNSAEDLLYFKHYLNQYNDFVISEVIMSENQHFKCNHGKSYFTQILLTIGHGEKSYNAHYPAIIPTIGSPEKTIVPGKDWLYFELYCHPQKMNFILTERISKFIRQHGQKFKTWFFIRYNDPSAHLRLRFQLTDKKHSYQCVSSLMELLAEELADGLITDVQLKTYQREMERYGHQQMIPTELHFSKDSAHVLQLLAAGPEDFHLYAHCISLMKATFPLLILNNQQQLSFVKSIQQSFEKEHQMGIEAFKKVNKSWSLFASTYNASALEQLFHALPQDLISSFKMMLSAQSPAFRPELFGSLFHMHINRLFSSHQRSHEMIIYSFLYKELQRERQRLLVFK